MPITESRRLDLYNGLTEALGDDRADTLMAYLPGQPSVELATANDVAQLHDALGTVKTAVSARIDRFEGRVDRLEKRIDAGFSALNQRIDKVTLTLAAGLIGVIAALIAQNFV